MLRLCEILVAWACLLQSIELLALARHCGAQGIWRWQTVGRDFGRLRPLFGLLLGDGRFSILQCLRAVAALCLLFGVVPQWSSAALLLLTLLTSMRFGGSFNGGSDGMTMVVLLAVVLGRNHETAALAYIGVQAGLSYLIAGIVKLRERAWRTGEALERFLALPQYPVPGGLKRLARSRSFSVVSCWGLMIFELGFPFAVLSGRPETTAVTLAAGAAFHWVNAWVLGLNRFFWAWIAAYPAIWALVVR